MKPQRKAVELPDGSEFCYYSTPLTLAERAKAQKASGGDDSTAFALHLLVTKACDENDARMFNVGDIPELKNTLPASVVEALMLQLLQEEKGEEEELDPKPSRRSSSKTDS